MPPPDMPGGKEAAGSSSAADTTPHAPETAGRPSLSPRRFAMHGSTRVTEMDL